MEKNKYKYQPTQWDLEQLQRYKIFKEKTLVDNHVCYPVTENLVITVGLQCDIPLKKLCQQTPSSYKKPRFAAVTIRFASLNRSSSSPTFQVFYSGNCVVMGASSFESTILYVQYFRLFLLNMGLKPKIGKMLLRNRVCSAKLGHHLNLNPFIQQDSIGCVVHKKSFPGVYHFVKPPGSHKYVSFLLFNTGSFIVMGLVDTNEKEILHAFEHILPLLKKHRLNGKVTNSHIQQRMTRLKEILNTINLNQLNDVVLLETVESILKGDIIDHLSINNNNTNNRDIINEISYRPQKKQKIKK